MFAVIAFCEYHYCTNSIKSRTCSVALKRLFSNVATAERSSADFTTNIQLEKSYVRLKRLPASALSIEESVARATRMQQPAKRKRQADLPHKVNYRCDRTSYLTRNIDAYLLGPFLPRCGYCGPNVFNMSSAIVKETTNSVAIWVR